MTNPVDTMLLKMTDADWAAVRALPLLTKRDDGSWRFGDEFEGFSTRHDAFVALALAICRGRSERRRSMLQFAIGRDQTERARAHGAELI